MIVKNTVEWADPRSGDYHIRMAFGAFDDGHFISNIEIEQIIPHIKILSSKFDIVRETKNMMSDKLENSKSDCEIK